MIPLRFVSSSLGAEIGYEAETKKITVKLANRMVEMIIGNKTALVNGKVLEMPVAPELISGSTFVPLRFLCENLNMKISVSGKKITISYVAE
ncbi:MAG: copper amine oxidase N-terminal domain-containing protein [Caldisericia bacterium]